MRRFLIRFISVPLFAMLFVTGCGDLELPFDTDTASQEKTPETTPADTPPPSAAPSRPEPEPPPAPTAESVLAAIQSKKIFEVTDADLLPFSQLDSGLEIVTELSLKGARLSQAGLKVLAELPSLTTVDLEGARVNDADWMGLAGATQLHWLNLHKSSISNPSMEALSGMDQLRYLDISDTRVSDPGFAHMANMSSLEELNLDNLHIEGGGMQFLGNDGAKAPLRMIHASGTTFGALGFVHVGDFSDLEELIVHSASVTDDSLTGLKKSKSLLRLNLTGNDYISDRGLKVLSRLNGLEFLAMNGIHRISDVGLKGLRKLRNLKELHINESACTEEGAARFKKSVPECRLYLNNREY